MNNGRALPANRYPGVALRATAVAVLMVSASMAQTPEQASSSHPPTPTEVAPAADIADTPAQSRPQDTPAPQDLAPRWLDAVRAQRRALQERRRAQHQARRRALDPVGTARQEALEQEFQRRRQEMRDMIAQDRWLFLNFGPWLAPLPSPPGASLPSATSPPERATEPNSAPDDSQAPVHELPDWDNGWYFRGW